ncbi:hypothetical protein Rhopal_002677-T1 [Rhodotorula paludigena]|uniref:Carboxylic ester hydrolase n=1 Tax=Rhodotorula paludigena TaxID=86838 RepID=A0AAV5GAW1_9BASI|nr:hypothetical protein Rhopal_002677-T1 [Rhodotorula paludigena]
MLEALEVYEVQDYVDGVANFTTNWSTPAYPAPVLDLPPFCRLGAYIHTSNSSKVQFEVWMPHDWSGRFAMVGNGGMAGGVNFPDMWGPIANYKMAVCSTDTGHNGTSGDGTFLLNGPETQVDFGYRAVHLTTVYSKKIVKEYYKQAAKHAYWIGCSSGGKQGLKEVQMYPEDFDGVIAGASALWWSHLNAQTYRINAIVNSVDSPGYLNRSDYDVIGKLVLQQCDGQGTDSLKDGIIENPRACQPDLEQLSCDAPGANSTACLSDAQIKTMYRIWADYHQQNGSFVLSGFEHGAEGLAAFSVNGSPYGPGPDYFAYQVLNNTEVTAFSANATEMDRLIDIADETDPGQTNAADPNIQDFLSRGKLLTYVGLADTLIPSGLTIWYYEQVRKALDYPEDLHDSFRMFTMPGMGHCRSGPGAFNFGGPGQRALRQGGTSTGTSFDKEHDMILAMIDWVEKGSAPDMLIGAKYVGDDKRNGTLLERPHCVYPKQAVYKGGDPNAAASFECENIL